MTDHKIINIDCKYYLPCGRCDKTNELCSLFDVTVITKPKECSANTSFYIPVDNNGTIPK